MNIHSVKDLANISVMQSYPPTHLVSCRESISLCNYRESRRLLYDERDHLESPLKASPKTEASKPPLRPCRIVFWSFFGRCFKGICERVTAGSSIVLQPRSHLAPEDMK